MGGAEGCPTLREPRGRKVHLSPVLPWVVACKSGGFASSRTGQKLSSPPAGLLSLFPLFSRPVIGWWPPGRRLL